MPITTKLTLDRRCLGAKIKHPAGNETAQDRYIGDDDGDVVFDMADAIVNWVRPVRLEEAVETIAILEVDFGAADGCNTGSSLASSSAG